jgi:hypothetical protein
MSSWHQQNPGHGQTAVLLDAWKAQHQEVKPTATPVQHTMIPEPISRSNEFPMTGKCPGLPVPVTE